MVITLGPDTFTVLGGELVYNGKGGYSCKGVDSGNGIVTAKCLPQVHIGLVALQESLMGGSGAAGGT